MIPWKVCKDGTHFMFFCSPLYEAPGNRGLKLTECRQKPEGGHGAKRGGKAVTEAEKFYTSMRWQSLRRAVLRRDEYMDKVAWRYGRRTPAEVVHHIFPRQEYPELEWTPWNLISVSRATHNRLHDRDTDELTELGEDLLRRTARKNGVQIPEKYKEKKKENKEWKIGKSQRG